MLRALCRWVHASCHNLHNQESIDAAVAGPGGFSCKLCVRHGTELAAKEDAQKSTQQKSGKRGAPNLSTSLSSSSPSTPATPQRQEPRELTDAEQEQLRFLEKYTRDREEGLGLVPADSSAGRRMEEMRLRREAARLKREKLKVQQQGSSSPSLSSSMSSAVEDADDTVLATVQAASLRMSLHESSAVQLSPDRTSAGTISLSNTNGATGLVSPTADNSLQPSGNNSVALERSETDPEQTVMTGSSLDQSSPCVAGMDCLTNNPDRIQPSTAMAGQNQLDAEPSGDVPMQTEFEEAAEAADDILSIVVATEAKVPVLDEPVSNSHEAVSTADIKRELIGGCDQDQVAPSDLPCVSASSPIYVTAEKEQDVGGDMQSPELGSPHTTVGLGISSSIEVNELSALTTVDDEMAEHASSREGPQLPPNVFEPPTPELVDQSHSSSLEEQGGSEHRVASRSHSAQQSPLAMDIGSKQVEPASAANTKKPEDSASAANAELPMDVFSADAGTSLMPVEAGNDQLPMDDVPSAGAGISLMPAEASEDELQMDVPLADAGTSLMLADAGKDELPMDVPPADAGTSLMLPAAVSDELSMDTCDEFTRESEDAHPTVSAAGADTAHDTQQAASPVAQCSLSPKPEEDSAAVAAPLESSVEAKGPGDHTPTVASPLPSRPYHSEPDLKSTGAAPTEQAPLLSATVDKVAVTTSTSVPCGESITTIVDSRMESNSMLDVRSTETANQTELTVSRSSIEQVMNAVAAPLLEGIEEPRTEHESELVENATGVNDPSGELPIEEEEELQVPCSLQDSGPPPVDKASQSRPAEDSHSESDLPASTDGLATPAPNQDIEASKPEDSAESGTADQPEASDISGTGVPPVEAADNVLEIRACQQSSPIEENVTGLMQVVCDSALAAYACEQSGDGYTAVTGNVEAEAQCSASPSEIPAEQTEAALERGPSPGLGVSAPHFSGRQVSLLGIDQYENAAEADDTCASAVHTPPREAVTSPGGVASSGEPSTAAAHSASSALEPTPDVFCLSARQAISTASIKREVVEALDTSTTERLPIDTSVSATNVGRQSPENPEPEASHLQLHHAEHEVHNAANPVDVDNQQTVDHASHRLPTGTSTQSVPPVSVQCEGDVCTMISASDSMLAGKTMSLDGAFTTPATECLPCDKQLDPILATAAPADAEGTSTVCVASEDPDVHFAKATYRDNWLGEQTLRRPEESSAGKVVEETKSSPDPVCPTSSAQDIQPLPHSEESRVTTDHSGAASSTLPLCVASSLASGVSSTPLSVSAASSSIILAALSGARSHSPQSLFTTSAEVTSASVSIVSAPSTQSAVASGGILATKASKNDKAKQAKQVAQPKSTSSTGLGAIPDEASKKKRKKREKKPATATSVVAASVVSSGIELSTVATPSQSVLSASDGSSKSQTKLRHSIDSIFKKTGKAALSGVDSRSSASPSGGGLVIAGSAQPTSLAASIPTSVSQLTSPFMQPVSTFLPRA